MAVKRIPALGLASRGRGKPSILGAYIKTAAGSYTATKTCWIVLTATGGGSGGQTGAGTGGTGGAAAMKTFRLFKDQSFSWVIGAGGGADSDGGDTKVTLPGGFVVTAGKGVFNGGSMATGGDINRSGGGAGQAGQFGGNGGSGGGGYQGGGGAAGFKDFGDLFAITQGSGANTFGNGGGASDHGAGVSGFAPGGGGGSSSEVGGAGGGAAGEVRFVTIVC